MKRFSSVVGPVIANFSIELGGPGWDEKVSRGYGRRYNRAHDRCVRGLRRVFEERVREAVKVVVK